MPTAPSQAPTPPENQRQVTGLNVRGCDEAGGYQCKAFLTYNTGDDEDVTGKTQWDSDDGRIARVDAASGQVTPRAVGTVTFRGRYQREGGSLMSRTQTVEIMLPPVQLSGGVWDTAGRFVAGAQLLVTDGPNWGTSTVTNSSGFWTLTVAPTLNLKLRLSHPAYRTGDFEIPLAHRGNTSAWLTIYGGPPSTEPPQPPAPPAPQPPAPPPAPATITEDFIGQLDDLFASVAGVCPDPRYFGREVRCRKFTLKASPHRLLNGDLVWTNEVGGIDSDTELGIVVRNGTLKIAESRLQTAGRATVPYTDIAGNTLYEVQVVLLEGEGPAKFTLRMTRTNIY